MIYLIWRRIGECTYFHSAPSPTMHIFIPRLLLRRLISFPALSYYAYFRFAHSPNTLISIMYANTNRCLPQVEPFPPFMPPPPHAESPCPPPRPLWRPFQECLLEYPSVWPMFRAPLSPQTYFTVLPPEVAV
jgi:hypothetical protein